MLVPIILITATSVVLVTAAVAVWLCTRPGDRQR